MKKKVKIKDIALYSKGTQINGDELLEEAKFDYLNGGIKPSGKWDNANCVANTVTISEGGNSCGYVNFMKNPFWCGAHCYFLYDTKIDSKYLYYALKSQQVRIMKLRSGACMPNIKKTDLGNFEFVCYDNSIEQKKITHILDKLECVIEQRKNEIQVFDELVKARFVEMFGKRKYTKLKWNDVFYTKTGKLDSNAATSNGQYPFFTCSKNILRIDNYAFDQEALLLSGNNASGKYDVKYYNGKFNAYQRTYVLGLKEQWSYNLMKYQLEEKLMYLKRHSLGGLTKYLTLKILSELSFIIPPMEKQVEFDSFVRQADKSKLQVYQYMVANWLRL